MNKPWKTKTCQTCENQVGGYCRLNPPDPDLEFSGNMARYPVVQKNFYLMACAQYEEVS